MSTEALATNVAGEEGGEEEEYEYEEMMDSPPPEKKKTGFFGRLFKKKEELKYMEDGSKYLGYIENKLPNGKGRMEYPDGEVYEGDWKEGIRHGEFGRNEYTDGSLYEGSWDQGRFHGRGKYTAVNKDQYDGEQPVRFGSVSFGSVRLCSALFGSVRFSPVLLLFSPLALLICFLVRFFSTGRCLRGQRSSR